MIAGSIFFKWIEDWHWIDSIYFSVVTMTTVGYGQFVPTQTSSKLVTTVFIITGVFISAVLVATIQQSIIHTLAERKSLGQSRWRELLVPMFLNVTLIAIYTVLCHVYDGMDWDTAFYFVIVSYSSVGYGDVLLKDRLSRSFGILFLLVGCACWTYLLTSMLTIIVTRFQLQHIKSFCREKITRQRLMKMDSNGTGDVSRAEFMEFMLLEARFVDPEVIVEVNEAFDHLAHLSKDAGHLGHVQFAPRPVLNLHQLLIANKAGACLSKEGSDTPQQP